MGPERRLSVCECLLIFWDPYLVLTTRIRILKSACNSSCRGWVWHGLLASMGIHTHVLTPSHTDTYAETHNKHNILKKEFISSLHMT